MRVLACLLIFLGKYAVFALVQPPFGPLTLVIVQRWIGMAMGVRGPNARIGLLTHFPREIRGFCAGPASIWPPYFGDCAALDRNGDGSKGAKCAYWPAYSFSSGNTRCLRW